MLWVTGAEVHIDRAARTWLIARFGDDQAYRDDECFDASEATGLDVILRGLSMVANDHQVPDLVGPEFDGLYACYRRSLLGHEGI